MEVTTVDSIVRSYIHEKGMVWHDYFRLLSLVLRGVKHIAMDINIGTNVKIVEKDVDSSGSAYLPDDAVDIRQIAIEHGDRLLGLSEVDDINSIQKYDSSGNAVKRTSNIRLMAIDRYILSGINDMGQRVGRYYGIPNNQKYLYKKIGNRIQFDARLELKCVYVLYTTTGVSMSDANVIHPWAEEAIKAFLDWKYTDARKGVWENQNNRRAFFQEKANANSRIHGFGYEEYMEIIRNNNVMTVKA